MLFQINGADVKVFGSRGRNERQCCRLSSGLEYMFKETGEYPALLDDAQSELIRMVQMMEYIGKVQTFITLTDVNQIPEQKRKNAQIFKIQSGTAQPMASISF